MCCHGGILFQILPSLQAFSGTESWVLCLSFFYFSFGSCVSADVLFLVDPPSSQDSKNIYWGITLRKVFCFSPPGRLKIVASFWLQWHLKITYMGFYLTLIECILYVKIVVFRETVRKPVECLFYSLIIVVVVIFKPQSVLLSSSCLYPVL